MKHIIFDLDNTLVNTSELSDYTKTQQGRDYLAQNIDNIETQLCNENLPEVIRTLHSSNSVSILTNAYEQYARAVLRKHGFPEVPLYSSANKPGTVKLRQLMKEQNASPENTLMIDDSAIGIIPAYHLKMPSIGITRGYSSEQELEKAGASHVSPINDIEDIIIDFEKGNIVYHEKTEEELLTLPESEINNDFPEVEIFSLGNYIPEGRTKNRLSKYILDFKESKNHRLEEIAARKRTRFFYNGELVTGRLYRTVVLEFIASIINKLNNIPKDKPRFIVSAPNSNPEFCYKFDANDFLIKKAAFNDYELTSVDLPRRIKRFMPKQKSSRTSNHHLMTIGIRAFETEEDRQNRDVIIFDDVSTSGKQIKSVAKLLRYHNIGNRYYGIVLGKTDSQFS